MDFTFILLVMILVSIMSGVYIMEGRLDRILYLLEGAIEEHAPEGE
jgi:hypothetical protein